MLSLTNKEKLNKMMAVRNCSSEEAVLWLGSTGGDLIDALRTYYVLKNAE